MKEEERKGGKREVEGEGEGERVVGRSACCTSIIMAASVCANNLQFCQPFFLYFSSDPAYLDFKAFFRLQLFSVSQSP